MFIHLYFLTRLEGEYERAAECVQRSCRQTQPLSTKVQSVYLRILSIIRTYIHWVVGTV